MSLWVRWEDIEALIDEINEIVLDKLHKALVVDALCGLPTHGEEHVKKAEKEA